MEIGEIIIIETTTDQITEIDQDADGTIIGQVIGAIITRLTIDKVIIDQIMDKTLNGCLETEVRVEIELEITIITKQEVEVEIEIMIDQSNPDKTHYLMEETDLGPRSNSRVSTNHDHVRCYRCREYNHFASGCPNMLTDKGPDCDKADPASLQMMTQNYYPVDSEREIEYLNL